MRGRRTPARVATFSVVGIATVLVAVLVGATTLFNDVAQFGPSGGNKFKSPERARAVDLQLAQLNRVDGAASCGGFSDDLSSGVVDFTGGDGEGATTAVCIRNSGGPKKKSITVSAAIVPQDDIDTACTGQEEEFDATCGSGPGELTTTLHASAREVACSDGTPVADALEFPAPIGSGAITLFASEAETPHCFELSVLNDAQGDEALAQAAQSDEIAWTYKFTAQYDTTTPPTTTTTTAPQNPVYIPANGTNQAYEVDYCGISPARLEGVAGQGPPLIAFADFREDNSGSGPVQVAEFGIGPIGSDPRTASGWTWIRGTLIGGVDSYRQYSGALLFSPGTYAYSFRVSMDGTFATYCDIDGAGSDPEVDFDPNQLGVLNLRP